MTEARDCILSQEQFHNIRLRHTSNSIIQTNIQSQSENKSTRKVTSRSGDTREVRRTTQNALEGLGKGIRYNPDSIKKKQVLKNNSLSREKTTAIRDGKKIATDSRKFSYGKNSVTQKQTMRTKTSSGGNVTRRYVDRTEFGGKDGKTPVSTSTTTSAGPISQTFIYSSQKNPSLIPLI